MNFHVLIMAGGSGKRLWPESTPAMPKQFLRLPEDKRLIQQAIDRAHALVDRDRVWIVTVASQVDLIREHVPSFDPKRIIPEPVAKNTMAATCLGTSVIREAAGEDVGVLVLPADHAVTKTDAFVSAMTQAMSFISQETALVTFGIQPDAPRTEYGYLKSGDPIPGWPELAAVDAFIEKPPRDQAMDLLNTSGSTVAFNSGMFGWRSDVFFQEVLAHAPKCFSVFAKASEISLSPSELSDVYAGLEEISIDYALMERTSHLAMGRLDVGWSDLGSWQAVYEVSKKQSGNNAVRGEAVLTEATGNLVRSVDKRFHLFGVSDLVIVESGNDVLVMPRSRAAELKDHLKHLTS